MLRMLGSLLIMAASAGFSYSIKRDLADHLKILYEVRRLFVSLSCEAAYSMQPVEILLGCFIKSEDERLYQVCRRIADRLMQKKDSTGERIWREEFGLCQKQLSLTEDEIEIIQSAGGAFFGKSIDENQKQLSLALERLDFVIERTRLEQKDRQRVYQTLSLMCGLMLIILLI